eukprot:CAMPEP_0206264114 /NCGR_PEP_ID=MMETSP0047_2-20121206/29211_1 /ASSEMBLY_ACC=CAM_ASM_000192 /TAXON_ID=195065 /ORGANISM="Chroomonas mesostigmatica_cf, Strain CCMP1168" /LENGTH=150 /DNA_ID=CAMNT_0053691765 /DNA_START=221 /DNA_END=670 /DNA_ORIENTATION=+
MPNKAKSEGSNAHEPPAQVAAGDEVVGEGVAHLGRDVALGGLEDGAGASVRVELAVEDAAEQGRALGGLGGLEERELIAPGGREGREGEWGGGLWGACYGSAARLGGCGLGGAGWNGPPGWDRDVCRHRGAARTAVAAAVAAAAGLVASL